MKMYFKTHETHYYNSIPNNVIMKRLKELGIKLELKDLGKSLAYIVQKRDIHVNKLGLIKSAPYQSNFANNTFYMADKDCPICGYHVEIIDFLDDNDEFEPTINKVTLKCLNCNNVKQERYDYNKHRNYIQHRFNR